MRTFFVLSLSIGSLSLIALSAFGSAANAIQGSVTEVYAMDFDVVSVSRIEDYLVIEYQKGKDGSGGKVAKLSVYVADLTISAGNTIDLTGTVGTSPRATLQRIVEGSIDMGIARGNIQFDTPPTPGEKTTGHFRITTVAPSGRTLNGDFQATVAQK